MRGSPDQRHHVPQKSTCDAVHLVVGPMEIDDMGANKGNGRRSYTGVIDRVMSGQLSVHNVSWGYSLVDPQAGKAPLPYPANHTSAEPWWSIGTTMASLGRCLRNEDRFTFLFSCISHELAVDT